LDVKDEYQTNTEAGMKKKYYCIEVVGNGNYHSVIYGTYEEAMGDAYLAIGAYGLGDDAAIRIEEYRR
jgi:hypothetical protein